ncbi:MAG TPA: argininosuccinate lyase [bacterium]|nr:argininosuccinate lyase [bacterium]
MNRKLWGGRFRKRTDPLLEAFSRSLSFDLRLFQADVAAGRAHAEALAAAGHLTAGEMRRLTEALGEIGEDIASGRLGTGGDHEDIHSLVLDELVRRTGEAGKKLHAGRSRNDLVSLDTRLYLREAAGSLRAALADLQEALVSKGEEYADLIFPGLTHTQHAQLVLFPHHCLAYVEMLERDKGRFADASARADVMPAGSAAMAGSSLGLDVRLLASRLGFGSVCANSMDAVSDRDFVIEFLGACAIAGMHLSRLCEELVWWSSSEIGFVRLDEAYCTGSSFLPQKLNPDSAELIRGKTGRLYGNLVAVLTVMKGLPLTYNRDMQEDKEPLFDSAETLAAALPLLAGVVRTLVVDRSAVERALAGDCSAASDLAEYLVARGIPFREAHDLVGALVRDCLRRGRGLEDLTLEDLRRHSAVFAADALGLLTPEGSLRAKTTYGSTAPAQVKRSLRRWRRKLGRRSEG